MEDVGSIGQADGGGARGFIGEALQDLRALFASRAVPRLLAGTPRTRARALDPSAEPGMEEQPTTRIQDALIDRVIELLSAIPHVGRLLWGLSRDPRVPVRHKLVLAGAAGYVIMPFDLIPDRLPGVGKIDDFVVIAAALDVLLNHLPGDVVESHWEGDPRTLDGMRRFVGLATQLRGARLRAWLLGDQV